MNTTTRNRLRSKSSAVWEQSEVLPVHGRGSECLRCGDIVARVIDPHTIEILAPWHMAGRTVNVMTECRTARGIRLCSFNAKLCLEPGGATARAVIWLPCSLFGIGGFGLLELLLMG